MMRLASVLFASLLAASLIAAALVVRAKTPDLMIEVSRLPGEVHDPATGERANHGFTPNGDGKRDTAHFTLFIRADEPHATIAIVGPFLRKVRTLDKDVPLEEDRPVTYEWDGQTNSGKLAPPGNYRIEVTLPSLDRDVVFPRRIALIRR
jgi:hypothetical protein